MLRIPLATNDKTPAIRGVSWYSLMTDDEAEHERWRSRGWNRGMVTGARNRIVVRDYDKEAGMALARMEYQQRREFFKCLVRTPSGGLHVYLKAPSFPVPNAQKVNGESVDLRGDGGYVVDVGSRINGNEYQFVPGFELRDVDDLPEFPELWLPPVKTISGITRGDIHNVLAYVMRVESFQGQAGSKGLVRAAAICRDEGYSESETLLILQEWNKDASKVNPPWSDKELARAATNVFKKGKR